MVPQRRISQNPSKGATPGRKRSEAARRAILQAAFGLVMSKGYGAVTTADIAAAASAGKQTIYRWWPSKAALILDALEEFGLKGGDPAADSGGSFRELFAQSCSAAARAAPVLRALMAEAQFDPALRTELVGRLIEPRRRMMRERLSMWGAEDEARCESLVLALYGALWYRLLLDEPLDDAFIDQMTGLASAALPKDLAG